MTSLLTKAREFALAAHGDQGYGSQPYRVHLDAVAELAREYGAEAEVVAYLHDVVEDTPVSLDELVEVFGARVAACVSILTDEPGDSREQRKRRTYARLAEVSEELDVALVVKAADRLANMRACVAQGDDELLGVYKKEHPSFRKAAYRRGLCWSLWHEMDTICASAQHGGFNFLFYLNPELGSLIRVRHRPGELHDPEIETSEGRWVRGPKSVQDAIVGLGDDVWSGPDWFAEPVTPEQARAHAADRGLDLFAEGSD